MACASVSPRSSGSKIIAGYASPFAVIPGLKSNNRLIPNFRASVGYTHCYRPNASPRRAYYIMFFSSNFSESVKTSREHCIWLAFCPVIIESSDEKSCAADLLIDKDYILENSSVDIQSSVSTSRVGLLYEVIWPVSSICTTFGCYQVYARMRKNLVYIHWKSQLNDGWHLIAKM